MIKKNLVLSLLLVFSVSTVIKADEGMWLPLLLKQLNEPDLKKNGLKLSVEDIYNINKSCLKDAIVQFNGGCTAEVISDKGLILTNHHCGYGQIQAHSSVKNDLLTNGFWAMNQGEELPNPGTTATFIIRMEDVTSKVLTGITADLNEVEREKKVLIAIDSIQKEAVLGTTYKAFIRPFFYGNEYYMFITETFTDVRLVGAPPSSIGKFADYMDNWVWPRHTGDFSIFRIYANADNKPADYSKDNVPYKPKYVLPITLKGVEKDDFTMVYGFPGKTTEYLTSYGVDVIMNQSDPDKVKIREIRSNVMYQQMQKSDLVRIQYSAKYQSLANYYKKWMGEMTGLKKANAIGQKQVFEKQFLAKISGNEEASRTYGKLFPQFEQKYSVFRDLSRQRDFYTEAIMGIESINYASGFMDVIEGLNSGKNISEYKTKIDRLKITDSVFFKNYDKETDQIIATKLLALYYERIPKDQQALIFRTIEKDFKGDFDAYAKHLYSKSVFVSLNKISTLLNNLGKNYKKIKKDPIYQLMLSCVTHYNTNVKSQITITEYEINLLNRTYVKGMREFMTDKKYYPDANSTLRLTYGKVEGYYPRDAVYYDYYTTIGGLMEKEDPSDKERFIDPKLKLLFEKRDYGRYADKTGDLRIAFCASNHTTGGNSGSPVLNANGELIGTNFDRDWEGTMSDVLYDPKQVRNIAVDIRYTLFVIDKFAGAGYLLNEMHILEN
ncbi:MAG TPA: S46 family peptidase [Bacteroidia bacterium]|jgi:hypothetical protein|nr:S46 family peptidase [Bacteroidia bacterium]